MGRKALLICILIPVIASCMSAGASVAYDSYTYSFWGEPVESPPAYLATETLRAEDAGISSFKSPKDLYVTPDNQIVVADTGNNRILYFSSDFKLLREVKELKGKSKKLTLSSPSGVFVKQDGVLLIADTENKRVIAVDENDNILREYKQPTGEIAFEGIDFLPTKVLADKRGFVYALCKGLYQGAVTYDSEGKFIGYFGANRVEATIEVLTGMLWRRIMTSEQIGKLERNVPDEFSNFDIDENGFIYTCTEISKNQTNQLKKINPKGSNILKNNPLQQGSFAGNFGDLEIKYYQGELIQTRFVDVSYDSQGYINALDFTKGRVFQYSKDSQLICIFGGTANQRGTFINPVAIDNMGDKLLVLDAAKNNITVFEPTPYLKNIHSAIAALNEGKYDEAQRLWGDIIKQNSNLELAYSGMGYASYNMGQYKEALSYFRIGNDKSGYAKALKYYRKELIQGYFPIAMTVIIGLGLLAAIWGRLRKRPHKGHASSFEYMERQKEPGMLKLVSYTLIHPAKGFTEAQEKKRSNYCVPFVSALAFFVSKILERQLTGFSFNYAQPEKINVIYLCIQTIGVFVLWCICNWAISTLVEGKAKFKDICFFSSVALIPLTISVVLRLIMSNVLLPAEAMFMTIAGTACIIWAVLVLLFGLAVYHEFEPAKTVWSSLLSVGFIIVVVFVCVLGLSLFRQMYNFVDSIVREFLYRI